MKTVHLLIKGKVQGVFYRANARKVAEKLGLCGWIKNTVNGDVESLVSGNDSSVTEFVEWCKQGPDRANVEGVIITDHEYKNFNNFQILH